MIGPWKRRDHGRGRTLVAVVASVPLTVAGSIVVARWLPGGAELAFAVAWLGAFLAWPWVVLGLLALRDGRQAAWVAAGVGFVLGVLCVA
ncbi:MAG: hypothetical protein H6733_03935 [Alphaproteobacteria bacterium]|nr:hypothetical protein [Alphaproteobacteria bacterium]